MISYENRYRRGINRTAGILNLVGPFEDGMGDAFSKVAGALLMITSLLAHPCPIEHGSSNECDKNNNRNRL